MKIIKIKGVSKIDTYIEDNSLELIVKYDNFVSVLHTTEHTNLYFDQFNNVSEALYWLSKDSRIRDLPKQMIKREAKTFFENILKYYPSLLDKKNN